MLHQLFNTCLLIFLLSSLSPANSQMMLQRDGSDRPDIQIVAEVGVMLMATQDTLRIDNLLPIELRAVENKDLELKAGDQILMMNAQPVKSIKEYTSLYENLKIGDEIKWGIRRGKEFRIITFKKADPEKMHAGKKMVLRVSAGQDEQGRPKKEYQYMIGKEAETAATFADLGFVLGEADGKLKVTHILEHAAAEVKASFKEGDRLLSFNGKTLTAASDFVTAYEKIPIGQTFQIKVQRNGKESEVSLQKKASRVKVQIRKGKADEK